MNCRYPNTSFSTMTLALKKIKGTVKKEKNNKLKTLECKKNAISFIKFPNFNY